MSDPTPLPTSAVDRDNPWPGLASFTEDARGFFFGREKETEELVRLVRRNTLTVLFGQSGLGKSSLLQAGAFPVLREADFLPLYLRLDHDTAAPALTDQVKAALVAAFKAVGADAPAPRADESLWEYFHRKDIDIWSAKNRLLTPVLAFDQFEEIFTLGRADETRRERGRAFLTELADLVENRPPAGLRAQFDAGTLDPAAYNFDKPSCQVILSLREDFLPDLEGLKNEMRSILHNRMRVKRLDGTQALEIVSRPAPHLLAEGVAERIVEFVAGARGGSAERLSELEVEPALLSVICRELNERRRANGSTQITADLVSGNRREILTDFYERSVSDLPEAMRAFAEDRLLTKSGFRDNLALETALESPGVTRPLLDLLVGRRLVRIEERVGVQRVELTHDVLAEVIRASRDTRQQRAALADAARRTRRQRWVIGGLATVVAALLVGAYFGLRAQRRAESTARQEASQSSQTDFLLGSRLIDEGKLSEGLSHLARAARKDPSNPVLAPRLLSELTSRRFSLPVGPALALPSPVLSARFTADGKRLVVQGEDQVMRIIDPAGWKLERELTFPAKVMHDAWDLPELNPDILLVRLENNTFIVHNFATGLPSCPPITPPAALGRRLFSLSPDGRWLGGMADDGLGLWSTATGQRVGTVPAGANSAVAFSPDSRQVATFYLGNSRSWSVPDGAPVGEPMLMAGRWTTGRVYSADGRRMFVGHERGIQFFDIATGKPLGVISYDHAVNRGAQSGTGGRGVVWGPERKATLLDLTTAKTIGDPLDHSAPIVDVSFSRDGTVLLTNSADGIFRIWDVAHGKLLAEPTLKLGQYSPAALSPDGRRVAVFTPTHAHLVQVTAGEANPLVLPRDPAVMLVGLLPNPPTRLAWLTPTHFKVLEAATGRETGGGYAFPAPVVFSGSIRSSFGQTLGAGDSLVVRVSPLDQPPVWHAWLLRDGGIERDIALVDVPDDVSYFRIAQRGHIAATTGTRTNRNKLFVWDLKTGRCMATFDAPGPILPGPTQIGVSSDRRFAAYFTSDVVLHVGSIETGRELCMLELKTGRAALSAFRFTADSKQILTGDNWGGIQVWDAQSGRLVQTAQTHQGGVSRFDFSHDGRFYASVAGDGSVQIWNAATHTAQGPLLIQPGSAQRADFSMDNSRLVIPSTGGSARIWDVQTGHPLTPPMRHGDHTPGVVAYGPDGRFVQTFTTAADGTRQIWLWPAPPDGRSRPTPAWLIDLATLCAGQRLTDGGAFESAIDAFAKMDEIRRTLSALPAGDPYAEWGRWFLSSDQKRPIAPGFTITPAEAEKLAAPIAQSTPAAP